MNMYKEDEQIIINFCKERNLSPASAKGYLTGIGAYTEFQNKSFKELILEAEKEEKETQKKSAVYHPDSHPDHYCGCIPFFQNAHFF